MENQGTPSSAENIAPENAESPSTLTGVEQKAPETNEAPKDYPAGYDAETYNLETGEFNKEGVTKRIEGLRSERDNFKKQATDLRKIVSKGKSPEDIQEYYDNIKVDESLAKYYKFEDGQNEDIKERVDTLSKIAKDNGLNAEQFNNIVGFMNETMVQNGVLSNKTQEEQEAETKNWVAAEMQKISADPEEARQILKSNVDFVKDFRGFNDDEKNSMIKFMDTGAVAVSAMNKFNKLFGGKGRDIPTVDVVDTGVASDSILAEEYYKKETSSARRQEILSTRRKAGRNSSLPLPRK